MVNHGPFCAIFRDEGEVESISQAVEQFKRQVRLAISEQWEQQCFYKDRYNLAIKRIG